MPYSSSSPLWAIVLLCFPAQVSALSRTIGPPNDHNFQDASNACNGSDEANFRHGKCPVLLGCVLDQLDSATTAGMQSGTNIASLIPTIMALIGAPPMELVQMAISAPHRALATCLFTIGLPTGLFRQLRGERPHLSTLGDNGLRERRWVKRVPSSNAIHYVFARVLADLAIVTLASVMLWRNWAIGSMSMVTWRCEYSYLLICWPVASAAWLVIACIGLVIFSSSIYIAYSADAPGVRRGFFDLFLLSYMALSPKGNYNQTEEAMPLHSMPKNVSVNPPDNRAKPRLRPDDETEDIRFVQSSGDGKDLQRRSDVGPTVTVRITMRSEHGIFSWRVYETMLETLAVGIYLYATFVLTSSVFISGQEGIIYTCVMTLGLSAVRILGFLL